MRKRRSRTASAVLAGATLVAVAVGFLVVYCWPRASRPSLPAGPAVPAVPAGAGARSAAIRAPGGPRLAVPDNAHVGASRGAPDGPVYHPRDKSEWQGMLVNMSMRALCSGARSCGLAAACLDGQCGPCATDDQCGDGERCVLDHCLLAANAHCRSHRDCSGTDALCVLSGYSPDPRGNADMRADCLVPKGGQALPDDLQLPVGIPAPAPPVNADELMDSVRQAARHPEGAVAR